ncbi:hypothetical protein GE061_012212 [Apolygus lucorum]|uniref:Uncharacterized protein n=1 Tax=Apolygus lucorum TaxID=248454 RepID=A0A8S9XTY3_APOLU|nr:hypothetical protein GE061_012212 [Apolygus lucorum]
MYGGVATPLAFLQQVPDGSKLIRVGQRSLGPVPQAPPDDSLATGPPPPVPARNNSRYTPPWPRGATGPSIPPPPPMEPPCPAPLTAPVLASSAAKPYLKPLPKPPIKQKTPWSHLQRHYSDESLNSAAPYSSGGGGKNSGGGGRVHSSADEISSLNHSPSISSSDESYSKTTDASPSPSPPLLNVPDTKQYLFPSDIQVNPSPSTRSADSSKKDNSSQTDLKMSTPESEQDFEKQIRWLIEEQSNLAGELSKQQASDKPHETASLPRYVSASVSPVARIVDIATYQQHLLGISHAIHDIDEELEEEEVRRLLAEEKEAEAGEASEWSDEEAASEPLLGCDRESTGYTTDDPALDNISMVHETGLTDAEGRPRTGSAFLSIE